jgi:anti-sigma-K factor RskA
MTIEREEPDRLDAIAALAALDLATGDEERALTAAGATGAALRRAYADTAAALALALPEQRPPSFASVVSRLPTSAAPAIPLRPRRPLLAHAAAATGLAAAAAFALLWRAERAERADAAARLDDLRQRGAVAIAATEDRCRRDADTLRTRLAAYDQRLGALQSPRLELATVRGQAGGTVKVFVDPQQRRWLVLAFELPPVADKDYQLWFVPDGGAPVSAGLLVPGPDGVLGATPVVPAELGRVRPAVSLEPRGGSAAPTDVRLVGEPI